MSPELSQRCAPCEILDAHDGCWWLEGENCDCDCHEGWVRHTEADDSGITVWVITRESPE